jgi:hypothetical protein
MQRISIASQFDLKLSLKSSVIFCSAKLVAKTI